MTADVTRRKKESKGEIVRKTIAYTKDAKVSDVTRFLLTVCSFSFSFLKNIHNFFLLFIYLVQLSVT